MGIWQASSIAETPEIELIGWKIFEVSSKLWPEVTRHFCGYNITEWEGRVSSAISEFDQENMTGKTKSGRVYKLSDKEAGMKEIGDAGYVWQFFVVRNQMDNVEDVTDQYKKENS